MIDTPAPLNRAGWCSCPARGIIDHVAQLKFLQQYIRIIFKHFPLRDVLIRFCVEWSHQRYAFKLFRRFPIVYSIYINFL
jgi:hypothetical protein